ncbi:hypothetical protein [Kitasatospora phosalacinea]|uniref:Secreted protein n=1 Tax=Kitasatospora phosalacinea TaxID=2065 RepID=A0A9W6PIJ1_9ACTN|nr:hypothetical protein [Kitasatospora phosalacinea]GLW56840.1 hypothetical protein Kpho01_48510 [Kitasatospora phosalacinea]
MSSGLIVALVLVLVVAAVCGVLALRRQQHPSLSRRFGPEYGRTVARYDGDTAAAERELARRVERHRELTLTPLGDAERARAEQQWGEAQAHFVDAPGQALAEADALLSRVARDRGYPDTDVDAQIDAISVDHGAHVESYRVLRTLAAADPAGVAPDTEEQRRALLGARELFTALVGTDGDPQRARPDTATKPRTPDHQFSLRREHHA